MDTTAIIAGSGDLPRLLADRLAGAGAPYYVFAVDGLALSLSDHQVERFMIERLAILFDRLHELGVTRVVFAGAVARPRLQPELIDAKTAQLLPMILPALQQGDDATLRAVIALFEAEDLPVVGADAVAPEVLPAPGVLSRKTPSDADARDAVRAAEIVQALGAVDVGQGCVVAQGLCLALESLPGTDAMLHWVARVGAPLRPDPTGARGVFLKAPKPGQDRRIDLPTIGPDTVTAVQAAGLAGLVIEAGGVMMLDPARTVAQADAAGLFLWVREP